MNIPKRCRHVYACLAGHTDKTLHVRQTGKWRNKDLQDVTGQSAADVRMRELLRLNPGEFDSETIPGSSCGAKQFWLKGRPWSPAIKPARVDRQLPGVPSLFAFDHTTD